MTRHGSHWCLAISIHGTGPKYRIVLECGHENARVFVFVYQPLCLHRSQSMLCILMPHNDTYVRVCVCVRVLQIRFCFSRVDGPEGRALGLLPFSAPMWAQLLSR